MKYADVTVFNSTNHFLKASQSRSHWDEMLCMSHLMHWDAHVFHTMNAKSQWACGVPFSNAEVLRLPRILSRDNSTQRNFKSFHFSTYSTLRSFCNDLPFSYSPYSLWHNKSRFWQLRLSKCLSPGLAKICFLVYWADKWEASQCSSKEMNEFFSQKRFKIFIIEDSTWVYSLHQNKTNKQKMIRMDWLLWTLRLIRLMLCSCVEFKELLIVGISSWFVGADFTPLLSGLIAQDMF